MNKVKYADIDDPEIRDAAYDYIFPVSDRIEYLNNDTLSHLDAIEELYGTEYEAFIPALISRERGVSWGMHGDIYAFKLTDEVKKIVKEHSLEGLLKVNGGIVFENAALYKGNKMLFDCCSHEGYTSFDDDFLAKIAEVCCEAIEKASCYADMLEVYNVVKRETKKQRAREKCILRHTEGYIQQEGKALIYQEPPYKCSFSEYKRIEKKYLPHKTYSLLNDAKKFADMHPNGYPQNFRETAERERFKNLPEEDELIFDIHRALFYLGYIEDKFDDRTDGYEEPYTPSVIIKE